MSMIVCEDDGDLVFNHVDDLIVGSKIAFMAMTKWGLTAHVGCDVKNIRMS